MEVSIFLLPVLGIIFIPLQRLKRKLSLFIRKNIVFDFVGDLYSFDPDDWEVIDKERQKNDSIKVQYRVVDLKKSSLCSAEETYTFFPDKYSLIDGTDVCVRFGGERVDISTQEKFDEVVQFLGGIKEDPAWSESLSLNIYTIHTDDEEFNVWRNI